VVKGQLYQSTRWALRSAISRTRRRAAKLR
jgi:hypothetical protein